MLPLARQIDAHVNVVRDLINKHNRHLMVVRKEFEAEYKHRLHRERRDGKIAIDHFGNLKGRTDYRYCDEALFFRVLDKGDECYMASALVRHENPDAVPLDKIEYKNTHRFLDVDIETFTN
ncbi:MAG TPA: hypothetical protein GX517_13385 [Alicyclobacillus sp.]|nr:hypothetical protein [Alicyclobacillus sp.]